MDNKSLEELWGFDGCLENVLKSDVNNKPMWDFNDFASTLKDILLLDKSDGDLVMVRWNDIVIAEIREGVNGLSEDEVEKLRDKLKELFPTWVVDKKRIKELWY